MGERFNSVILLDKLDKTRIFSILLSNNSENPTKRSLLIKFLKAFVLSRYTANIGEPTNTNKRRTERPPGMDFVALGHPSCRLAFSEHLQLKSKLKVLAPYHRN